MKDSTAIKRAQEMLKGKPVNKPALRHLIRRLVTNRNLDHSLRLIYLESKEANNPKCKCPVCGQESRLMQGFSLLAAGFNGVTGNSPEDLDVQECGRCGALLEWD